MRHGDFDIDPAAAPAVVGVVASSDAVQNVEMQRLFFWR
jgi:hypothetical protein